MAFNYDPTTDLGKVRLIISDTDPAAADFQDEELQGLLDINSGSVRLAAALAAEALARRLMTAEDQLGDYKPARQGAAQNLLTLADKLRRDEYETPAFAEVEQNLSAFNELEIVNNHILRTLRS